MEELTQLGRYQILERLGSGSYAVVYKAYDPTLNRIVALKVLKPAFSHDQELFNRFQREARAAANLIHPHIAWVWELGEANDKHFLSIRYIQSASLDKVIAERGKIPWTEAMQYMQQMCEALDFAHSRGIIHRDIKPQNILIGTFPEEGAVLTDFGLVKAVNDSGGVMTRTGVIMGTPQYIPPEVWNGETVTAGADQYALVCVFLEMLNGKPLFDGSALDAIVRKHLGSTDLWETWPNDVPPLADSALRRALAKNPADRFPRLKDLFLALKDAEASGLSSASLRVNARKLDVSTIPLPDNDPFPPPDRPPGEPIVVDKRTVKDEDVQAPADKESAQAEKGWVQRLQQAIRPGDRHKPDGSDHHKPDGSDRHKPDGVDNRPLQGTFTLRMLTRPYHCFNLQGKQMVIGRSPTCDVYIDDLEISRRHATLSMQQGGGYTIKDLSSTNGTFVNGQRVTDPMPIYPGNEIMLGQTVRLILERQK